MSRAKDRVIEEARKLVDARQIGLMTVGDLDHLADAIAAMDADEAIRETWPKVKRHVYILDDGDIGCFISRTDDPSTTHYCPITVRVPPVVRPEPEVVDGDEG